MVILNFAFLGQFIYHHHMKQFYFWLYFTFSVEMALFSKEYIIMIFQQYAYKLTTFSAITRSVFIKKHQRVGAYALL